jgi:esterase/lipase superfamily enzyme
MNQFTCSEHAVRRYQERINRRISFGEAKKRLLREVVKESFLYGHSDSGEKIFQHKWFRRRYIVKEAFLVMTVETY